MVLFLPFTSPIFFQYVLSSLVSSFPYHSLLFFLSLLRQPTSNCHLALPTTMRLALSRQQCSFWWRECHAKSMSHANNPAGTQ
jgi:hypothetical protein